MPHRAQFDNDTDFRAAMRDYFAAAALPIIHQDGGRYGDAGLKAVAEQAYRVADAMLKARALACESERGGK